MTTKPPLFDEMNFAQKIDHLEKCRLNAIECIKVGEPSNLANIADWFDIWGPWLIDNIQLRDAALKRAREALEFVSDFVMAQVEHKQAYVDDIIDIKERASEALKELDEILK